jgi:Purple acid Phosphatase, N-terminal domain/Repeat of unknown function (DUF5648)
LSNSKRQFFLLTFAGLLLLPAIALAQSQPLTITNGPVVEDVAANSAEIAWTTNTGGSSVIRYGTDPNNLSQTAQESYQSGQAGQHVTHRVKIKNLQPGTTYYYQVLSGQGQGTGTQVQSQVGQFTTSASGAGDKVPFYRALSQTGGHLFTDSYSEVSSAQSNGWTKEGIAGYIDRKQGTGTEPLYRLVNPTTGDHFYTANAGERSSAIANGYRDEGVAGYLATSQLPGTAPLYRLLDPRTNQHFYTADPNERQSIMQQGWRDEGVAGYIWKQ